MSIEGGYKVANGQASLQVDRSTTAYQTILDKIQVALPYEGVRAPLAQTALHGVHAFVHEVRVYEHGVDLVNRLHNAELISDQVAEQSTQELRSATIHDLGKIAVADTLPGSNMVMHGTVYDAKLDLRTPQEQSDMARHAQAGNYATEIMKKDGLLNDVPSVVIETLQEGQREHHSTPTPVVSMRGKKISYMEPVFRPSNRMSYLTNLVLNIVDVRDAMWCPRLERDDGKTIRPSIVGQELAGLMRNTRIEMAFGGPTNKVEQVSAKVLKIATTPPAKIHILRTPPDISKLTWNGKSFIQPSDIGTPLLHHLASQVWDSYRPELDEIGRDLEKAYQAIAQ